MSSSRAACSTIARDGTGADWLRAIVGANREQESAKAMVRVSITPAMVSLAGEPIPDWRRSVIGITEACVMCHATYAANQGDSFRANMNEFGVLTNRRRALIALIHSI